MSNYDEMVLGVGNSLHPANQVNKNVDCYEELANELFNEKMEWMKKAMDAEFYLLQIKLLADGMKDTNGLATIISNLLKEIE